MANGYELIFYDPVAFDETSHEDCYVWDPAGRQLMVSEIYGVQVFNDYLFIHAAADDSPRIGFNVTAVHGFPAPSPAASRTPDRYFEIDTKTGDITDYRDEQDLRVASAQRGIMLHLTSTLDVYLETLARGRPHWTFNVILLIPLAAGAIWLLGKILQLRRSSTT